MAARMSGYAGRLKRRSNPPTVRCTRVRRGTSEGATAGAEPTRSVPDDECWMDGSNAPARCPIPALGGATLSLTPDRRSSNRYPPTVTGGLCKRRRWRRWGYRRGGSCGASSIRRLSCGACQRGASSGGAAVRRARGKHNSSQARADSSVVAAG